ncbi:unnamed protein product [Effrenium voratum]|uniref:Uncharacterized protein n=1 Tax=Effrenium voratum TaxID=2562239 RepID=A0AA36IFU5_9DINO|nr:unnamed protein product [Effrenium voratum]CAJ1454543.1 unnamed protein product [Effrenium voratum]
MLQTSVHSVTNRAAAAALPRLVGLLPVARRHFCRRAKAEQAEKKEPNSHPEQEQARTRWGERLVVLGMGLRGAALLPRLAPAANALRFAGVGPMAVGAVVSIYELGGWRLMLAVPATLGAVVSASMLTESKLEDHLKEEILKQMGEASGGWPPELLPALREAKVSHYESNRCKVQAQCGEGALTWKVEVHAERRSFPQPWQASKVQVSRGEPGATASALPPQTRHWEPPLQWSVVWSQP